MKRLKTKKKDLSLISIASCIFIGLLIPQSIYYYVTDGRIFNIVVFAICLIFIAVLFLIVSPYEVHLEMIIDRAREDRSRFKGIIPLSEFNKEVEKYKNSVTKEMIKNPILFNCYVSKDTVYIPLDSHKGYSISGDIIELNNMIYYLSFKDFMLFRIMRKSGFYTVKGLKGEEK